MIIFCKLKLLEWYYKKQYQNELVRVIFRVNYK
jgi:hypothetical protein